MRGILGGPGWCALLSGGLMGRLSGWTFEGFFSVKIAKSAKREGRRGKLEVETEKGKGEGDGR